MDYVKKAENELEKSGHTRNEVHCLAAIGYAILALQEAITRRRGSDLDPFITVLPDGEVLDRRGWDVKE